jgi:hypothetical protein
LTTITTPAPALVAVAKRRLAVLDGRVHAITQVRDRLATELQKVGDDGAAR